MPYLKCTYIFYVDLHLMTEPQLTRNCALGHCAWTPWPFSYVELRLLIIVVAGQTPSLFKKDQIMHRPVAGQCKWEKERHASDFYLISSDLIVNSNNKSDRKEKPHYHCVRCGMTLLSLFSVFSEGGLNLTHDDGVPSDTFGLMWPLHRQ